ncbi:unnamed protein product [Cuscuta europaea]|uniref:PHD-type domain-containing protein n=1 Tax=Cuscuta europaea TaxID=41803 RepID=A0A9P1EA90_CUSEU|nr:unnamed protein product [Cuscuta europaea]
MVYSLRRRVGSATPGTVAPMKLEQDVPLEVVPSLANYTAQPLASGVGVDDLGRANVELSGTSAIGESSGVRIGDNTRVVVYSRSKRLKTAAEPDTGPGLSGPPIGISECSSWMRSGGKHVKSSWLNGYLDGKVAILGQSLVVASDGYGECNAQARGDGEAKNMVGNKGKLERSFNGQCEKKSDMVKVKVKKESKLLGKNGASKVLQKRFTRSSLKLKVEVASEIESIDCKRITDTEVLKANGDKGGGVTALDTGTERLEKRNSKKILLKRRPSTVRELLETGLLEGYPVFYKGVLLRGIIKGVGILCSCEMCNGSIVVPPSKFEVHACKSYKKASSHICLENGKSLHDVVKECRKYALKTLDEIVRSFIGPPPVLETSVCQNCKGPFLATSAAKHVLCDLCLAVTRSEAEEGTSEPVDELNSSASIKTADSSVISSTNPRKKRKASEPESASNKHGPFKMKTEGGILKKFSQSNSVMKHAKSSTAHTPVQTKDKTKITKKAQKIHCIVFEEGGLPDGTELSYYSNGKRLVGGYKNGSGIFCKCCNTQVSPSQFEAHAGCASRKKPYMYIYTSNGVSLHEFAISLLKGRNSSVNDSDDLCIVCADGGNLVLCDGCPRSFHKECAHLDSVPSGKWFCKYCENLFKKQKFVQYNDNALAAGRVSGIDSIEQITKRCIRIVKNPEEVDVIACVICRGYDYSCSGFGPRTVILCDQCEKEYHIGCLKQHKMADLKELPKGKWFCCSDCKRIYSVLQNLLSSREEKLPNTCLDTVRAKGMGKGVQSIGDIDVRWRLLSGKIASPEVRALLAEAVTIFHDCFDPIVDSVSGRDFIPSMVYGRRNIRGQDFGGMHCAVLTLNSTVVSAATLRIFGQDAAEIPLVATRIGNQGKGYFQLLFSCIEKLLAFLNVKTCVLPAAYDAISIWTNKFGFKQMPADHLEEYRKTCWQMVTFKGSSMLEKRVPQCRIIRPEASNAAVQKPSTVVDEL